MSNSSVIIVDEDIYQLCVKISTKAHKGQKRKFTNEDYIKHPLRVSDKFEDNFMKCLAVMHDVREDNPEYTIEKLHELTGMDISYPLKGIKDREILHKGVIDRDAILDTIADKIKEY